MVHTSQETEETDDEAAAESTPLLGGIKPSGTVTTDPVGSNVQTACAIWTLAWPLAISFSFTMAQQQLNAVFVGHLGPLEPGAATLGLMWTNISGSRLCGVA